MLFGAVLFLLPTSLLSLICSSCPFKLEPPHSYSCADSCEGNICYIVVNKYFNGTVIAGCLTARETDSVHNGTSVCHRKEEHTVCACTSSDKCNDPRASLSPFDFTEHEILEGQQIFPQIQPTEPPVVTEEQSILLQVALNETSVEDEKISLVGEDTSVQQEPNISMGFPSTPIPSISDQMLNTKNTAEYIFVLLVCSLYM